MELFIGDLAITVEIDLRDDFLPRFLGEAATEAEDLLDFLRGDRPAAVLRSGSGTYDVEHVKGLFDVLFGDQLLLVGSREQELCR